MVQIREAALADIEEVWKIEDESFSDTWSKESFKDLVDNKNTKFLVAVTDERIVGYCIIYLLGDQADIANVAVSSLYRRNSIAEKMINQILAYAKEAGVKEVFLEVRQSNEPAINLYNKMDFETIGRRKNYYSDPKEDAMIMMLHI